MVAASNQVPSSASVQHFPNAPAKDDSVSGDHRFQLFIQSPSLQLPNRVLTLTLDEANRSMLGNLKLSLVPYPVPPHFLSSLFFSHNGKILDDSSTLVTSGIPTSATLTLHFKVLGGGGDGGATGAESRDCYLNMYAEKKPDKVDPNEKRLSKWTTCALSFEPLKPPCVTDRLGNVFNKEALVKSLLAKTLPKTFSHIKGLKDMITIHLSLIPGLECNFQSQSGTWFHCPISGLEFNGKYKFLALSKCGHVFSAKALKEVKSSACLVCHQGFEEADKIVINGTDEEVAILRERMEEGKTANKLKDKKPKKVKVGQQVAVFGEDNDCSFRLSGKKHGFSDVVGVEKPSSKLPGGGKVVNAASTASSTEGTASTDAPSKRFKAVDIAPPNANKEVYASIFTSSKKSDFKETFTCRSLPLGRN